jgi:hypothetical protein
MQIESRVMTDLTQMARESSRGRHTPVDTHRLDNIAAAMVIGLTAMFVVTIFGMVTDFIPSLLFTVIIGSFIGISSGAIAYIIMRN